MIIKLLLVCFVGYLIGRIGDWYGGHLDTFHHWIYGILLVIIGVLGFVFKDDFSDFILSFGIGLVISDLKDLFHFRIFGPDKKVVKKFWGID